MKKIAILGCSFSHWFNDDYGNWNHHIAKDYPNTQVDCYAFSATGFDFCDYVIDYILDKDYDCVIYQVSMQDRITFPVYNVSNPNLDNEWNKREIKKSIPENFTQYEINHDLVNFTGNSVCLNFIEGVEQGYDPEQLRNNLSYLHQLNTSTPPYFERRYIRHIQNLHKRYEPLFDKFFWYVHQIPEYTSNKLKKTNTPLSNIGQTYCALEFMIKNYGNDPIKFFNEILISEEDHHFRALGNKLLYENYILKSKIGEYLND